MDPTANLKEQLRLANWIIAQEQLAFDAEFVSKSSRLADLVEALDEWIRKGGFLPDAWRH